MITVEEAAQQIEAAMPPRPVQQVTVAQAGLQILAEPVLAERDQPPFDRVMMDGIAIAHAALGTGTTRFRRTGIQAAGTEPKALADRGDCIEVMTGAALPAGCDCIVPVEQVSMDDTYASISDPDGIKARQFIHPRGSDYRSGRTILSPGTRLGAAEMAVLASSGSESVSVACQPAIEVLAVGDELVDPGAELASWQIRRSNDFAIETLLHGHQLTTTSRNKLPDNADVLEREIGDALKRCDVLVLTGGVSMGRYDYIPRIMQLLEVEILLHRVAQAPGKPMWVGRRGGTMVFALPGNPVSALVCARRYVVPAIESSIGIRPAGETAVLGAPIENATRLTRFVPVISERQETGTTLMPRPTNTSGDFHALAGTAGFVALAPGARVPAGATAEFWRWHR